MRMPRFTIRRLMAIVAAASVLSLLLAQPYGWYGVSGPQPPSSLAKIVAISSSVALVVRLINRPVFALLLGGVAGAFSSRESPQGVLIGLASSALVVLIVSGWDDKRAARHARMPVEPDPPEPK